MFSKELEELIEASLVDGVITDKEREVIKKRAVSEGVDPDEVDIVLDSEVQKIRKKQQAAMTKVKKCPNCGEVMPTLSGVCPSCGHTVDVSANDNKELFSLIEDMENALVELKSDGADPEKQTAIIEKYRRMAKTLYSENKKVQYLLAEIDAELTNAKKARRKKTILKYIVRYGWIVLAVLCVFVKCQCDSYNEKQEKTALKEQYQNDKPQIDIQYEELCKEIDELEDPTEQNYKEMTRKLLAIVWIDISESNNEVGFFSVDYTENEYEKNKKNNFIKKKEAYAEQLQIIYKKVYEYGKHKRKYGNVETNDDDNSMYYDNTPDEIISAHFYN